MFWGWDVLGFATVQDQNRIVLQCESNSIVQTNRVKMQLKIIGNTKSKSAIENTGIEYDNIVKST
jgi:hypothetical protein